MNNNSCVSLYNIHIDIYIYISIYNTCVYIYIIYIFTPFPKRKRFETLLSYDVWSVGERQRSPFWSPSPNEMFLFLFLKEIPGKEQSFPAGNKSYTKNIISFKNMPSAGWVDDFFFLFRKDLKLLSLLEQPVPAPVDQSRHSLLCGSSGHRGYLSWRCDDFAVWKVGGRWWFVSHINQY